MTRTRRLVVIGIMSVAMGGCRKETPTPNGSTVGIDTAGPIGGDLRRHTVEGFLSDTGRMKAYDSALVVSLCALEAKTRGLDSIKRICPTGNPKDVKIPTYPPYPPK